MDCMLRGGLHWHGSGIVSGNYYILFVLSLSMTSMISIFVSIVESGTNKFENVRCLQLDFILSCLVLHIDYLSCKSFDYTITQSLHYYFFHAHLDAVFGNCWDPTPCSQYLFGALCTVLVFVSDWVLYNGIIYMLDFIV